jgi:hypothetical protein
VRSFAPRLLELNSLRILANLGGAREYAWKRGQVQRQGNSSQIRFGFDANQKAWSMHHIAQDST